MAKIITAQDLKKKIEAKERFYLIDALAPTSFGSKHIPGAINIPNAPDFVDKFEKEIGAPKDAEIIIYCSVEVCDSAADGTDALEKKGYMNVYHFKDGLTGWLNAGYSFEGMTMTR